MCSPAALIALNAGQQTLGFIQQRQVNRAEGHRFDQAKDIARKNAIDQHNALARRSMQEGRRASEAINSIVDESRRLIGSAKTSAAEGNVQGQSVSVLLDDFRRIELTRADLQRDNLEAIEDQIRSEHLAVQSRERANALSAAPRTPKASLFNTALNIGASAVATNLKFNPPLPTGGQTFTGTNNSSLTATPGVPGGYIGPP